MLFVTENCKNDIMIIKIQIEIMSLNSTLIVKYL